MTSDELYRYHGGRKVLLLSAVRLLSPADHQVARRIHEVAIPFADLAAALVIAVIFPKLSQLSRCVMIFSRPDTHNCHTSAMPA
jgi:hypothetical protein